MMDSTMPYLKRFKATVNFDAYDIRITTDHYNLMQEATRFLKGEEQQCGVNFSDDGSAQIFVPSLNGTSLGDELVKWLQGRSWQITSVQCFGRDFRQRHFYILNCEEVFTSIADDMEKLADMYNSGAITAEEYKAFKRSLTQRG